MIIRSFDQHLSDMIKELEGFWNLDPELHPECNYDASEVEVDLYLSNDSSWFILIGYNTQFDGHDGYITTKIFKRDSSRNDIRKLAISLLAAIGVKQSLYKKIKAMASGHA